MAVSKCTKCGGEISSHAKKCPHCGVTKDEAIPRMTDCAECGKEFNLLTEGECPSCGAPKIIAARTSAIEQSGPRSMVVPIIAAIVITAGLMAAIFYPREPKGDLTQRILDAIPSAEEGEFPTPESAVEHYVKCLKSGDVTSMAKVLAIKEMVTHWDFKSSVLDVQVVQPNHGNMEYRHSKLLHGLGLYRPFYDKMIWNMTAKTDWGQTVGVHGQKGKLEDEANEEQEFEGIFGPTRNPDLSGLEHEIVALELPNRDNFHRRNQVKRMKIMVGMTGKRPS